MCCNVQVENMRLTNGLLFGLPIVFDTDDEGIKAGDKILLKQVYNHTIHCIALICSLLVHV
jgi:ATP sulfurylase